MKDLAGVVVFFILRPLERLLSVRTLYRLLRTFIAARFSIKRIHPAVPLPACLGVGKIFQMTRQCHVDLNLNRSIGFFPDRLGSGKWSERCRMVGLDSLEDARRRKRPVILAFCHFGPYFLLRFWLRSIGVPAAFLIRGEAKDRTWLKRMKDRVSPFAELPTALYQDQLREAIRFLEAGNVLLLALDVSYGKQMRVSLGEGWTFQMATGPFRLAARCGAEVLPCSIVDEGGWRYRLEVGRPVPAEWLAGPQFERAGEHLILPMLPLFRSHPEQWRCDRDLLRFQRESSPPLAEGHGERHLYAQDIAAR